MNELPDKGAENSVTTNPSGVPEFRTSSTLLRGLRNVQDSEHFEASWRRFHRKYAVIVAHWCESNWGLGAADADDIAADVMVKVLRTIKRFQYRRTGSFRAWMYTVTRRAVIDYWNSERHSRHTGSAAVLNSLQAREDLLQRLNEEFDMELLAEARRRVEGELNPRDWTVFVALTEQGKSPTELADAYQLTRNHVDNIKLRVLQALREQIRNLEASGIDS